jgi:MoxR-like ATPase
MFDLMTDELTDPPLAEQARQFAERFETLQTEIGRAIVGHQEVVKGVLISLFVGGHCLLEGVPGLGKTLLVRTLAEVLGLRFNRIQFTPDLMPSDILGTNMVHQSEDGRRVFEFQAGPIFTQLCLADEINRATPKTQSALLETMQEGTVTVAGKRHELPPPFLVLATQNPLEQEGTYPLPEAQLDRFLFKLVVGYASREQLNQILARTTGEAGPAPGQVMGSEEILRWQRVIRQVVLAPHVQDYIARLVLATHPGGPLAAEVTNRFVRCGASPRGAQAMALAAKVRALLEGRFNVSFEDVRRCLLPSLRHRLILNFDALAEGVQSDQLLEELLGKVSERA